MQMRQFVYIFIFTGGVSAACAAQTVTTTVPQSASTGPSHVHAVFKTFKTYMQIGDEGIGSDPVIEADVTNTGPDSYATLDFRCDLHAPDRKLPISSGELNLSLEKVLHPGETQHWSLRPNPFGDLGQAIEGADNTRYWVCKWIGAETADGNIISGVEDSTDPSPASGQGASEAPAAVLNEFGADLADTWKMNESLDAKVLNMPGLKAVTVEHVKDGSIADSAGLKSADLIYLFDGRTVNSAEELEAVIGATAAGKKIQIGVIRSRAFQKPEVLTLQAQF